jgi:DNA invertase Pin-like site-specific DNA recombinase
MILRRRSASKRRGPRSRAEVGSERQKLRQDTEREIEALVAEFHALLPRDQAKCLGAIYARYSSRYQHSVADQVRGCLQAAVQLGVFVPLEHVFFDLAVRGAKERGPGFDQLKEALARKAVRTLLILTTNRLSRKTYKSLQFVEEEVVGRGVRCVFVKSSVDTADEKRWRMLLNHFAAIDEFVSSMYADNIRVAQEGLFQHKLVFGTISFGYRGKEVAGPPTRQKRPRCEYEIDPDVAPWVVKVFQWFVDDRLTLAEIIRRLNADPAAPLGPKAVSGRWTRLAVKLLLANPRYRGWWVYGKTQTVWQPKQDYSRQLPREQPLCQQQFEDLRIVSDALWYTAQARLSDLSANAGRRPVDRDRKSRPRLLNNLFVCGAHGRRLSVGGPNGRFMLCPECQGLPAAERPLYTHLNRALALRLTCAKLAELVRADEALVAEIVAALQREAEAAQRVDPAKLAALKARLEKLSQRIRFVLANSGDTEADRQESEVELRRMRAERAEVEAERAAMEAAQAEPTAAPNKDEVGRLLVEMADILAAAAQAEGAAGPAREIVEMLTGGRIELEQQGLRRAHRGWLRGRFQVRLLTCLHARATRRAGAGRDEPDVEVTIDYRAPSSLADEADRAKLWYDEGLLNKQIAQRMGCARNWITKILRYWFESRGLTMPDGRARRSTLVQKQMGPVLYRKLSGPAKALWDEGLADVQIAAQLGCSPPTAAAAVAFWHTSRGLEAPSHEDRQAAVVERMHALYDQKLAIREVAKAVGMCTRSVTLLLRERLMAMGLPWLDGRSRRATLPKQSDQSRPPSGPVEESPPPSAS